MKVDRIEQFSGHDSSPLEKGELAPPVDYLRADRECNLYVFKRALDEYTQSRDTKSEVSFPDFGVPIDIHGRPLIGLKSRRGSSEVRADISVEVDTNPDSRCITVSLSPRDPSEIFMSPLFSHDETIHGFPAPTRDEFTGFIARVDVTNNSAALYGTTKNEAGDEVIVPIPERPSLKTGDPTAADVFASSVMNAVDHKYLHPKQA